MYISGPSVSLNIRMLQAFEFLLKLGSHSDYMHTVHTLYKVAIGLAQGGDTPIDAVVTAATGILTPYTKEVVESQHILPYTIRSKLCAHSQAVNS